MALAASLGRPASFLPAIKCSQCGDEIEIAAMGDHDCNKAPPSPKPQAPNTINPFTLRQMNANGVHTPSPLGQSQSAPPPQTPRVRASPVNNHAPTAAPRATRAPPPQINPDAANQPFLAPRPSRSESPMSPALSIRSASSNGAGRPPPMRSCTSPMPRIWDPRPPSPEMSANLDCAFPPFPAAPKTPGSGSRSGTSSGRNTPAWSDRAHSQGSSRQGSRSGAERRPSNYEQKLQIRGSGDATTASKRRPSLPDAQAGMPFERRRPSLASIRAYQELPPIPSEPLPIEPMTRPETSHPVQRQRADSTSNFSRPDIQPQKKAPPPRPERPSDEVLPPDFLDRIGSKPVNEPIPEMPSVLAPSQPPVPLRSPDRSQAFPLQSRSSDEPEPSQILRKIPTEPQIRGPETRPPLVRGAASGPSRLPQARSRSQSTSSPGMDLRLEDAPPVPKTVQEHRLEGRHTPTGSGSSVTSSVPSTSTDNGSSSGPSPIGSAASSVDAFSHLNYDSHKYGVVDDAMRVAGLNFKSQQPTPGMRAEQPAQRSPPRNIARRHSPPEIPVPPTQTSQVTMPAAFASPMESPMDPAMQGIRPLWQTSEHSMPPLARTQTSPEPSKGQEMAVAPLAVPKQTNEHDPYRSVSPRPAQRTRSKSNAASTAPLLKSYSPPQLPVSPFKVSRPDNGPRSTSPQKGIPDADAGGPFSPPQSIPTPPPVPQTPARSQTPLSRRGTAARAPCRGCNKSIEGKSVKAADGRLTGRWHKACFTCRTCEQPFTTADFYVIDNHPYCEQHYHEKNGSLCHGCNCGIEGQYLETTSSLSGGGDRKFHPRCFTCHDCRQVLSDDYFEISGKVYCERHALAAMRGQARLAGFGAGGLSAPDRRALTAERRTTRLGMMMLQQP
ncbi:Zinc-binding domain present in Lin-11, Isl-1, Mec-3 [Teratosphaeria destructans]|uniref:Zinc-binding domain present in Lin-11, Isl-1, Mec-3 n=1 Tax=Teratosphaeria destructans TaxID=418781 RepID=A0A9W7W0P1_9PEZI|nr:Zinc-binding domain present in Lin-11, Isl-1, Mec-3 [Teratosphaeria destructans]